MPIEIKINSLYEYYKEEELKDYRYFINYFGYNSDCAFRFLRLKTYQLACERKTPNIYKIMGMYVKGVNEVIKNDRK